MDKLLSFKKQYLIDEILSLSDIYRTGGLTPSDLSHMTEKELETILSDTKDRAFEVRY